MYSLFMGTCAVGTLCILSLNTGSFSHNDFAMLFGLLPSAIEELYLKLGYITITGNPNTLIP